MKTQKYDALIIGAGLSGLACAMNLEKSGLSYLVLEASESVGGRVKTDSIDGFLLDRGFQIFLTAYPEAQEILDYSQLRFQRFEPGALVRRNGKLHKLSDPFQSPKDALSTMMAPIGTPADKVRIATVRTKTGMMSLDEIDSQDHVKTITMLKEIGFTDKMIEAFLKPFLSGIFLESNLDTTRTFFDFVFRMLAHGDNVLPSGGMKAIPEQMASHLKEDSIRFESRVVSIADGVVELESGEKFESDNIVLATEESATRKLLGISGESRYNCQTTIYFSSDKAPFSEPMIAINGEAHAYVTNVAVHSNVAPSYAPDGKALIAVSVVGAKDEDNDLERKAKEELTGWFGKEVDDWQLLKIYRVKYSLPDQSPSAIQERFAWIPGVDNVILAGDYMENGSINGAMKAGRKAAEKILSKVAVSSK